MTISVTKYIGCHKIYIASFLRMEKKIGSKGTNGQDHAEERGILKQDHVFNYLTKTCCVKSSVFIPNWSKHN